MPSSRRLKKLSVGAIVLAALVGGTTSTAAALSPANDTKASATPITALPFDDTVDTTDATTDAAEAEYAADTCGSPSAVDHAVWYTGTVAEDALLVASTAGSDYDASILVLIELDGGTLYPTFCGPDLMAGNVTAGTTYYVMVFGDGRSDPTGGELHLNVRAALPPPELQIAVAPIGLVDRHGVATVFGILRCTSVDGTGEVLNLDLSLSQQSGPHTADGFWSMASPAPCDGTATPFVARIEPFERPFKPGGAATLAAAEGCGPEQCTLTVAEPRILLVRRP